MAAVAASSLDKGDAASIGKHMDKHLASAMPTISRDRRPHREKQKDQHFIVNLMVARPVGRQENSDNSAAQAAMQKEWAALKEQKVWNLMMVREKSDIIAEAKSLAQEVQFGRVHGICIEKNFRMDTRPESTKDVLCSLETK